MTDLDHEAAKKRAQKMVATPRMFKRENLELAACYLDSQAKLTAERDRLREEVAHLAQYSDTQFLAKVEAMERATEAEAKLHEVEAATVRMCVQAVDDAGGDNTQYHIDAIHRALAPERTEPNAANYQSGIERTVPKQDFNFRVRTDGEYWALSCKEIPGLFLGGISLDDLFADVMAAWRKLAEVAPRQVLAPPERTVAGPIVTSDLMAHSDSTPDLRNLAAPASPLAPERTVAGQPDLGSSSEPLVTKATSLDTHERSVLNREDAVGSVTACRDEPVSPLLPGLERAAEICADLIISSEDSDAVTCTEELRAEISRMKGRWS